MGRIVIKLGGSFLIDDRLRSAMLAQIAEIDRRGYKLVLVHGGGKQIADLLNRLSVESRFHDGLRITDTDARDAVQMMLAGKVGKDLAAELGGLGVKAVSLAGGDGDCFLATKMPAEDGTDLGFVGRIVETNPRLIDALTTAGFIPIIACLGLGIDDRAYYNINGDQMAAAVAAGLQAEELIFVTDVGGVNDGNGRQMSELNRSGIEELLATGIATGGMRPKLRACLEGLSAGVARIRIVGAQIENVLVRAIVNRAPVGPTIVS
jgi:acetylglutamate kinase